MNRNSDISTVKSTKSPIVNQKSEAAKNPFVKLMEEKRRIAKAFQEKRPLSSLGISFVKPL